MSIPLYFAMPSEVFEADAKLKAAQLDFSFCKDGTLSVPKQIIPNSPIIINDAFSPAQIPGQATISHIISLSSCGCFLDFERPPSAWSISFIKNLQLQFPSDTFLAVPPKYIQFANKAAAIIPSGRPVNNWTQFCKEQQTTNKKWILEVIPYKICIPKNTKSIKQQTVSNAVCICRAENSTITYYETFETVLSKLEIAEYYGCIGGIGLYQELDYLKKMQSV